MVWRVTGIRWLYADGNKLLSINCNISHVLELFNRLSHSSMLALSKRVSCVFYILLFCRFGMGSKS